MNHYPIIRFSNGTARTICGNRVLAHLAISAGPFTCPECNARLIAKAHRESCASLIKEQREDERQLHIATARTFANYASAS
jgi:hypothetical protein